MSLDLWSVGKEGLDLPSDRFRLSIAVWVLVGSLFEQVREIR